MAILPVQFLSALDQAKLLRSRKISSVELLNENLGQYGKLNGALNAVIVADVERATLAAAASDRRLKKGAALGPFDGVPMTVKESFNWSGTPTTWGAIPHRDNIAKDDAVALTRLTDAGAVLYGKTNVPFMLADWQSFNDIYGTTNNPWDVTRVPGGSSGGSAVALATGMSALELGSDIGASIRNPAHYCGVYGHKPSYGIVPMRGHTLGTIAPTDISCAGPLARSASDLAAMLRILAAPDGFESRAMTLALPKPRQTKLKEFRVAVMVNDAQSEVDQPLQDLIGACAGFLEKKVKAISYAARPAFSTAEAFDIYIALLRSATSRRQSLEEFAANEAKVKGFDPVDRSYLSNMLRAYVMPHRSWLIANERRHQMQMLWDDFFNDWDVLICPTAASAAFPHDHAGERHERMIDVNGKRVPTVDQLFWAGYSCGFGLPSTVAPIGLTSQGLPGGLQIISRVYDDLTAIRFAELLEREYHRFTPPPMAL